METSASFEARSAPSSYPTVRALGFSEDSALKRIRAARTARRFPVVFSALADGRLHLSGVVMVTPYLTDETGEGLIEAASRKRQVEFDQLLANRFPRPDLPAPLCA